MERSVAIILPFEFETAGTTDRVVFSGVFPAQAETVRRGLDIIIAYWRWEDTGRVLRFANGGGV